MVVSGCLLVFITLPITLRKLLALQGPRSVVISSLSTEGESYKRPIKKLCQTFLKARSSVQTLDKELQLSNTDIANTFKLQSLKYVEA